MKCTTSHASRQGKPGENPPTWPDRDGRPVYEAALEALDAGLSVIPIRADGTKAPDLAAWKPFQDTPPSRETVAGWFPPGSPRGLGLPGGRLPGGGGEYLTHLDFDVNETWLAFERLARESGLGETLDRSVIGFCDLTPNGGRHIPLWSPIDIGNQKLARRQLPDEVKTLIETKAAGGYVVAAPSNGRVHDTGRAYVRLCGTFRTIAHLSAEEAEALLELARTFDEMPVKAFSTPLPKPTRKGDGPRPGDVYNAETGWPSILGPLGWTRVYERDEETCWRRPGKSSGISATTNYKGLDLLKVFSTNAYPFDTETTYSKFAVYTLTQHNGDFSAAAKALAGDCGGTLAPLVSMSGDGAAKPKAPGTFANYTTKVVTQTDKDREAEEVEIRVARRINELDRLLDDFAPGWPKRVEERLFVRNEDDTPTYLTSAHRLIAWLDPMAQVDWMRGAKYVTQERFYEHLRMSAEQFESISSLPHFPALEGVYYMHRHVGMGDGTRLDQLLDFFCPLTELDRELIRALIMTPFWGGPPGKRPVFLVSGPDEDEGRGRGTGKSTLIDILAVELCGGYHDISPSSDIDTIKTRIITPGKKVMRVVRIDNLKALRFSWSDFENLITAPYISGHGMYEGEKQRFNDFVFTVTVNGASLSEDMAQRAVQIKLARPPMDATWDERVRNFIRQHRWEIIADIRARLEDADKWASPITPRTRWAPWKAGVLSRVDEAEKCQKLFLGRQGDANEDAHERDLVEDGFAKRLKERGYNPGTAKVLIPSETSTLWLSDILQKKFETTKATAFIKGLGSRRLSGGRKETYRGIQWTGVNAGMDAPVEAFVLVSTWSVR